MTDRPDRNPYEENVGTPRREDPFTVPDAPRNRAFIAGGERTGVKIARAVFLVVLLYEAYLCWSWLVQPLLPIIRVLIDNHGTLPLGITPGSLGQDSQHPIGMLTIGGMEAGAAFALFADTMIRTVVFSIMFGVTIKIYRVIRLALH